MKYVKTLFLIFTLVCLLCSCSNGKRTPDESQIKAICELSTLECKFNNVAKGIKEGNGWWLFPEKQREFWVEYEGIAKIGIDMDAVEMKIKKDNTVVITMPPAELLGTDINTDSLTEDSYISSKDGFWNKNKITIDDQRKAINEAQEKMKETIMENKSLLNRAEKEAKTLIENYVKKLGDFSNTKYTVEWKKAK